jgi:hypothetical protein
MATRNIEINTQVFSFEILCNVLQQKIDHTHSFVKQNFASINTKLTKLELIPN